MSCNFLNFKDCQIKGSTFSSVKFNFPGRDISGDTFFMLLKDRPQRRVNGIIVENEVLFPYESFQDLMIGRYAVEFWADFADIGLKAIARQELEISEAGKASKCCEQTGAVFGLNTGDTVVEYSISLVVINLREGGEVQWDEIEGKPTVFYDDTEIKEEISKKVDKVEGYGLSENNFSDADLEKLEGLENFDPTNIINALGNKVDKIEGKGLSDNNYTTAEKTKLDNINLSNYVLQSSLNSQLASYVLQSNLNTQLQSYATLNGVQTFNSTITFAQAPIVPTATLNGHAVNLGQLANVNVLSATRWQTARTLTIGSSGKSVNGSANITWTLAEIGAVPVTDMIPIRKTIPYSVSNSNKYNGIPNKWVNLLLNSQGVDKTFLPFIEVSDDGITWTNLNATDIYKYFTSHETNLQITNTFFRFTFKTIESLYQYFYIGIRHRTSGLTLSGKYEFSANGVDNWATNTEGGNDEQVVSPWGSLLFFIRNSSSTRFHRLTIQKHAGVSVGFVQIMMYSNASEHVDSYTVAKTDLQIAQVKLTANTTLSNIHSRNAIIGTSNLTIQVPSNLADGFEAVVYADGGNVSFSVGGTVFKGNGGKTMLLNGGMATLRKENGTNNFYLKGDLT